VPLETSQLSCIVQCRPSHTSTPLLSWLQRLSPFSQLGPGISGVSSSSGKLPDKSRPLPQAATHKQHSSPRALSLNLSLRSPGAERMRHPTPHLVRKKY
jgi:hypothetical protein